MTTATSATTNTLDYALYLTALLPDALLHATRSLSEVQLRSTDLEGRTCTGNPHWRDKANSSKTPKLYVLHGTDESCPIHGQPAPGERLRVYIGNKPDKIADALAAIERTIELKDLQRTRRRLQERIDRTIYKLENLYRSFGYPIPKLDPTTAPILNKDGQMATE